MEAALAYVSLRLNIKDISVYLRHKAKKLPPPCLINRHRDESLNSSPAVPPYLITRLITKSTFHSAASVLPGAMFMNVVLPGFHFPRLAETTNLLITFPISALSVFLGAITA